jgi:peptidoglycan/xylan/chitin deacetylase (PgdA/CDA1 family)
VLERHGARATFFMIGECAQNYPELVREAVDAGHTIANHSWNHPSFPVVSRKERISQMRSCEAALAPHGVRLFRPPYGHQDHASYWDVRRCGYEVVAWDAHARDWRDDQSAEDIANQLVKSIHPGAIVLLHDSVCVTRYIDRKPLHEALDIFLQRMAGSYRFLTLPELFQRGRKKTEVWVRETNSEYIANIDIDFGYDMGKHQHGEN